MKTPENSEPIQAAGGIVVREGAEPLIAIVQLRKDKAWVLPKGKLKPGEEASAGAKREAWEETGHDVELHEYLGTMSSPAGSRVKIVQFWRMRPLDGRPRKLMRDVRAVQWLPLDAAIKTLTHAHEAAFLTQVGPAVLTSAARGAPVRRAARLGAMTSESTGRAVMRWILAALYVAAGIAHIMVPEKLLSITPAWVPFAPQVIFLTGLFELGASVALVTRPLRWWAGIGLAAYALCVWPANFKHAFSGVDIPYLSNSWFYHGPRLAFQPVIIWWALYCAGVIDWPWRGRLARRS